MNCLRLIHEARFCSCSLVVLAALIAPIALGMQSQSSDAADERRPRPRSANQLAPRTGQDQALAPIELPDMNAALAGPFNVTNLSPQILRFSQQGQTIRVQVNLGNQLRTLELQPHSIRAPDCKFLVQDENGLQEIAPPPSTTFQGTLLEDRGARVSASVVEDSLTALVEDQFQNRWIVEPMRRHLPGAPADWHVVYNQQAVLSAGSCGVAHGAPAPVRGGAVAPNGDGAQHAEPLPPPEGRGRDADLPGQADGDQDDGGIAGGPGDGLAQIAFDADFEFYQANGSSVAATLADIEMVMNTVRGIYQSQMLGNDPICYQIRGFIVRTTAADPYSSTNPDSLLCQFRDEWNDNVPDSSAGIPRDVAHLFTGKDLDGTTIGIATVGWICDSESILLACGLFNINKMHYGLSQRIANGASRFQLTAHELGHNFDAEHCDGQPDCGIMNSFVNGSLTFGVSEQIQIDNYRDSLVDCLTPCLSPLYVNDDPLPGLCGGVQYGTPNCWYTSVAAGYDAFHWVGGGTMAIAPGSYPGPITFNNPSYVPMQLVKWNNGEGGTVVIGAP